MKKRISDKLRDNIYRYVKQLVEETKYDIEFMNLSIQTEQQPIGGKISELIFDLNVSFKFPPYKLILNVTKLRIDWVGLEVEKIKIANAQF